MAEERSVFADYVQTDVHQAYQEAQPRSWQDLIDFLRKRGLNAGHATPGKDAHMIADAIAAIQAHVPFPDRWDEVHAEMRSHRDPRLVHDEEHRWNRE